MRSLVLLLLVSYVSGLSPVCRKGGRLRSDLNFKYTYKNSIAGAAKDIDFSQRDGEYIYCDAAGTQVHTGAFKATACESVARAEGPGMDRFGWAKQLAVATKGSIKVFAGDVTASPTEFTAGDECGSSVKMSLGGHYMAVVCKKGIKVFRYDGTAWSDHDDIDFNSTDHELKVDLNHEDYMIVSKPSAQEVKIYKLGAVTQEIQSLAGDGEVAAAVNCKGSVFAYESAGSLKVKQLSQKDGSWSDLADISVDAVSLSMSNDVMAVGLSDKTKVYMFANGGTQYAEYKSIDIKGNKVSIEHDDLAIIDDTMVYLLNDGPSTKCLALQKLDNGVCVDCGPGHTNAHDNTETTCNIVPCSSSQFAQGNVCYNCPAGATNPAGPATTDSVCSCPAGKVFNMTILSAPTCDTTFCLEDEMVAGNACEACPAGSTNAANDDASGADTTCDATLCGVNEHVVSNACANCTAGSTNAKDDDASGADTQCDPDHQCLVNQFYTEAGACQNCPDGSLKAEAVSNLDGDTSCDNIICAENEHVTASGGTSFTFHTSGSPDTSVSQAECQAVADADPTKVWNGILDSMFESSFPSGCFGMGGNSVLYYSQASNSIACSGSGQCIKKTTGAGGSNCTACQAGTERPAGDDATLGLTQCLCSAGTEGDGTTCTACLANQDSVSGEPCKCTAGHESGYLYTSNEKKYAGTTCGSEGDCESACSLSGACEGYSRVGLAASDFCGGPSSGNPSSLADVTGSCSSVNIRNSLAIAMDANKDLYIQAQCQILKISNGVVSLFVGQEVPGTCSNAAIDGTGSNSSIALSTDMKFDSQGNLIAISNQQYLKITPEGAVTTLAGTGDFDTTDGNSTFAKFKNPEAFDFDAAGNILGVDRSSGKIRSITANGDVTTECPSITLNSPYGVAYSTDGSNIGLLYVAETDANKIRLVNLTDCSISVWKSEAGWKPYRIQIDGDHLMVARYDSCFEKRLLTDGSVVDTVGTCGTNGDVQGTGSNARFDILTNFVIDGLDIYINDRHPNNKVKKLSPYYLYGAKQADTGGISKGRSIGCATCPANSNSLPGVAVQTCVKNEAAIWYNEVVNGPADAGACVNGLYCNTKSATTIACVQSYEDGGVLQATTSCCILEQPTKCLCEENHRVSSGACVACATGEVRPAGDNPDNGNTYCNTQGLTLAFTHNGNSDFVYNAQNDPDIQLKVGQLYTFLRDSADHPLRVVSAADCPSCSTGTWSSLPTSSVSNVDSEQGSANIVWKPRKAGTYYYVCTSHPDMVGKLIVSWDVCALGGARGALYIGGPCQFNSQVSLTGPTSISVATARLRSSENIIVSMDSSLASAIDATIWPLSISGIEITDITSDNPFAKSTTGTIDLNGIWLQDNGRNTQSGALFKTDGGGIIAQNIAIDNTMGDIFEGINGGDVSLADSTISNSGNVIKQNGGAVLVRGVTITGGGKLADIQDATSVFEDVTTDGGEGIDAVKSSVQIERSNFKGHASAPVKFNSKACSASQCKRELIVENTVFEDAAALDIQTDSANKPRVKIIEGNFTNSGSVVASEGIELYVIDEIEGKEMTTAETKTETCLAYQCSHKPLATSCKIEAGKGTKCVCDIGVASYNAANSTIEKATTVNDILAMLFATGGSVDRIVKLVDEGVRYIPTQPTSEAAKSNILLTKPTNADGEFQSEKTILMKPDTGVICATFQTWMCTELTACHYANGTMTADCDGTKILNGTSNTNGNINRRRLFQNRFFKLQAVHPDDPNCAGAIVDLRQQCQSGSVFYSRCVQDAQFHHDVCKCTPGLAANSGDTACVSPDNLCKINERVSNGRCVPCAGDLTNKAGDDRTGEDKECDDVICKENTYVLNGECVPCAAGAFNLAGDIAKETDAQGNTQDKPDTVCCGAGQYEFETTSTTPFRTCKSCADLTDGIRARFGVSGAGLQCCGNRLGDNAAQCDRIMEYYRKVCQKSDTTCAAQSYS
jgi:plastocyanin